MARQIIFKVGNKFKVTMGRTILSSGELTCMEWRFESEYADVIRNLHKWMEKLWEVLEATFNYSGVTRMEKRRGQLHDIIEAYRRQDAKCFVNNGKFCLTLMIVLGFPGGDPDAPAVVIHKRKASLLKSFLPTEDDPRSKSVNKQMEEFCDQVNNVLTHQLKVRIEQDNVFCSKYI